MGKLTNEEKRLIKDLGDAMAEKLSANQHKECWLTENDPKTYLLMAAKKQGQLISAWQNGLKEQAQELAADVANYNQMAVDLMK